MHRHKVTAVTSNAPKVMRFGQLHFKALLLMAYVTLLHFKAILLTEYVMSLHFQALLLTANVTPPRFKSLKVMGIRRLLFSKSYLHLTIRLF